MLIYMVLLLLTGMAVGGFLLLNQRARGRRFREFAATAGRTLQLETCSGIGPTSLYEYLLAIAMTLRTQAMIRNLKLRPGEFEQVVTDAIESAYLLKREHSDKNVSRGSLSLFAICLDSIISKTLSGEATVGNEGSVVGTVGAVAMLASVGWYAESNADLVTCALTETSLAAGVADYWRTSDPAYRDRVEASFEHVFRIALDPATATYVRHKAFADLIDDSKGSLSKDGRPKKASDAERTS